MKGCSNEAIIEHLYLTNDPAFWYVAHPARASNDMKVYGDLNDICKQSPLSSVFRFLLFPKESQVGLNLLHLLDRLLLHPTPATIWTNRITLVLEYVLCAVMAVVVQTKLSIMLLVIDVVMMVVTREREAVCY